MKRALHRLVLLFSCALTVTGFAGDWRGACSMVFASTVTRGPDFSGTVNALPFAVTERDGAWSMTVEVKVANMDTNEAKRDKDMRAMLHADTHESIVGHVERAALSEIRPAGSKPGTIPFTLTINGVTKEYSGKVTNWQEKDNGLTFDVTYDVSLKAHSLEAPSIGWGLMKVDDIVRLTSSFSLSK